METSSGEFRPPFCPRPGCPSHCSDAPWAFKKAGFYVRKAFPHTIPRYHCGCCGASFSRQTFRVSYWLKRPDLLVPVFHRLVGCSGFRQIAREFGVSHTTVMRLSERLGRHCLLFQQRDRAKLRLDEPVAIDGFESFAHSQYYPCHLHLAAGSGSHFLYAFTDSELRRKGRMTDRQKKRREELESTHGRPDPQSVEKEVAELVRLLPAPTTGRLEIFSDEHPAYPRALARTGLEVRHEVTPSTAPRTSRNPLFPVNLADLLIRHCSGNHKRETIAFSKTRQNAVERLALFQVWRNYMKSFSEKKQDASPAMRLGLAERKLTADEILSERLFVWKIGLPQRLQDYYWRRVATGPRGTSRPHQLKLAL
jgi:transposase-like protein